MENQARGFRPIIADRNGSGRGPVAKPSHSHPETSMQMCVSIFQACNYPQQCINGPEMHSHVVQVPRTPQINAPTQKEIAMSLIPKRGPVKQESIAQQRTRAGTVVTEPPSDKRVKARFQSQQTQTTLGMGHAFPPLMSKTDQSGVPRMGSDNKPPVIGSNTTEEVNTPWKKRWVAANRKREAEPAADDTERRGPGFKSHSQMPYGTGDAAEIAVESNRASGVPQRQTSTLYPGQSYPLPCSQPRIQQQQQQQQINSLKIDSFNIEDRYSEILERLAEWQLSTTKGVQAIKDELNKIVLTPAPALGTNKKPFELDAVTTEIQPDREKTRKQEEVARNPETNWPAPDGCPGDSTREWGLDPARHQKDATKSHADSTERKALAVSDTRIFMPRGDRSSRLSTSPTAELSADDRLRADCKCATSASNQLESMVNNKAASLALPPFEKAKRQPWLHLSGAGEYGQYKEDIREEAESLAFDVVDNLDGENPGDEYELNEIQDYFGKCGGDGEDNGMGIYNVSRKVVPETMVEEFIFV